MPRLDMLRRILKRQEYVQEANFLRNSQPESSPATDPRGPLRRPLRRVIDPATGCEYWVPRDQESPPCQADDTPKK